ncbi:MAG: insulinase family protein [Flavobacteriaceae bacterium]|nr:insulinase family protein [Flavobacteriaceae bacterium]
MKKSILLLFCVLLTSTFMAQKVSFEEFDLENGLHVILHQDNTAPVVTTAVMYHVGAKDENPERTGFAHFFEHLLFEGTENIERGKWFEIVTSNGGKNNANTNDDRTYYYEVFPSNNLELGLWMEAERMLHPVINQIGVDTQNEVVKEEKRLRVDNQPYGNILAEIKKNMFVKHPYRWTTIGSMDHLDAATLEEFQAFNKKFYIPNNAVLVVAGDINITETKKLVNKYFSEIPKGTPIKRETFVEDAITEEFTAEYRDSNIQIPMLINAFRIPSMKTREAYILDMISTVLSDGKSSRLFKKMVEEKKNSLNVGAVNFSQEDYGMYILYALPLGETTMETLQKEIDEEIVKIQTELISEKEMEKLKNKFLNQFVNSNSSVEGIAHSLASFYMLHGDINLINNKLDIYNAITREEIKEVANKYLKPNQRLILNYLPKEEKK